MPVTNCGFQSDGFQNDAFQVCTPPVPVIVGSPRGYGRMRIAQLPARSSDDEAVVAMLLELLDE